MQHGFVTLGNHHNRDLATRARCHSAPAARTILAKSGPFMQWAPHLDNSGCRVFRWGMGQFLIASGGVHLVCFVTLGNYHTSDLATRASCHSAPDARIIFAKSGPFMKWAPYMDNSGHGVFRWDPFLILDSSSSITQMALPSIYHYHYRVDPVIPQN